MGRAAVTGRINAPSAQAALRSVREWRQAHQVEEMERRLDELREALAEWKESGSPDAVLKLVQ